MKIVLSPGDSVRIVVWRKPEMSGDFIVGPDGTITHATRPPGFSPRRAACTKISAIRNCE